MTTLKNTVTVNEGDTTVVTVAVQGPQGPAFIDGDLGDIVISGGATVATISAGVIDNTNIASNAAIVGSKISPNFGSQDITTTGNIDLPDTSTVKLGTDDDFILLYDNPNDQALIAMGAGKRLKLKCDSLHINNAADDSSILLANDTGSVSLFFGTGKKFETTSTGATITGDLTLNESNPAIFLNDTGDNPDYEIGNFDGVFIIQDNTNNLNRFVINTDGHIDLLGNVDISSGLDVTGDISVSGNVDGRDVAADGTKLDGIETGATADQTAAEIKTLLNSNGIVNAQIDANAAIAGTKISPDFGSQAITTTGDLTLATDTGKLKLGASGDIEIFHDGNHTNIMDKGTGNLAIHTNGTEIQLAHNDNAGTFEHMVKCITGGAVELYHNGSDKFATNSSGAEVRGNLAVTGTVDGRDVAADGTKLDGIEANAINASNTAITNKLPLAGGTITGNLTVGGDLTVNGTNTVINTTTLTVEDLNIELGKVSTPTDTTADQGGITLLGATNKTFQWLDATGSWTSSEHIALPDNKKLQLGASQDLLIYHQSSNNTSYLQNTTDTDLSIINNGTNIYIKSANGEKRANFIKDEAVELYFDNVKKFETTSDGATITGVLKVGNNNSKFGQNFLRFEHNGTGFFDHNFTGQDLNFRTSISSSLDTTAFIIKSSGNVQLPIDNQKLEIGASQDLQLYHDSTNSIIANSTGNTYIKGLGGSGNTIILEPKNNENSAKFIPDGAVELYFDNSKKLETTSTGATITGDLTLNESHPSIFFNDSGDNPDYEVGNHDGTFVIQDDTAGVNRFVINTDGNVRIPADNAVLQLGASQDLEIFHNGSNSFFFNNTGYLQAKVTNGSIFYDAENHIFRKADASENMAKFLQDGAVELYFDNSLKLNTNSAGVAITGTLTASGGLSTSGTINSGNIGVAGTAPTITLTDTNANDDFEIKVDGGLFEINDTTNSANRFIINSNGTVNIAGNLDVYDGIDLPVDNKSISFGASADLSIKHDGTNSYILNNTGSFILSADNLKFNNRANNETKAQFINNGAVELYYDNSKKLETTSTGVSVTGGITATSAISIPDAVSIFLGNSNDISLKHDGTNSFFINNTGYLQVKSTNGSTYYDANNHFFRKADGSENMAKFLQDGAVELYFDGVDKFSTTSTGATINGTLATTGNILPNGYIKLLDNQPVYYGTGNDLYIFHDGTNSKLVNTTGHLKTNADTFHINNAADNESFGIFTANNSVSLFYDNSKKFETTSTGATISGTLAVSENIFPQGYIKVLDNQPIYFGTGNDLVISHNGSTNVINSQNYYQVNIKAGNTEDVAKFKPNSSVELYYDNVKKFETTSYGVFVNGNLKFDDNNKSIYGNGDDLNIFHDGSHSHILHSGTGNLAIHTPAEIQLAHNDNAGTYEHMVRCITNGAVELYYDGSKKLETVTGGILVTGSVTTQDMNMSNLNGSANEVDNTKGSWSIQEGSNDLFIINRVTGKKYKFNLTEIS